MWGNYSYFPTLSLTEYLLVKEIDEPTAPMGFCTYGLFEYTWVLHMALPFRAQHEYESIASSEEWHWAHFIQTLEFG